jgi:hypothetical protein
MADQKIDHKAEALDWSNTAKEGNLEMRMRYLAHAQVHATLHLADQVESVGHVLDYICTAIQNNRSR